MPQETCQEISSTLIILIHSRPFICLNPYFQVPANVCCMIYHPKLVTVQLLMSVGPSFSWVHSGWFLSGVDPHDLFGPSAAVPGPVSHGDVLIA